MKLLKKVFADYCWYDILLFTFGYLFLVDIFLEGSGNILKFYIFDVRITVRMCLFSLTMISFLIWFFFKRKKIDFSVFIPFGCLLLWLGICFIFSCVFKNNLSAVFEDIKPLLGVLFILPCLLIESISKYQKNLLIYTLYICASIVSIICIALYFANKLVDTNIALVINDFLGSREFVIRDEGGGIYCHSQSMVFLALVVSLYELFVDKKYITPSIVSCLFFSCLLQAETRTHLIPILLYMFCLIGYSFRRYSRNKTRTNILLAIVPLMVLCILFIASLFVVDYSHIISTDAPGTEKRFVYLRQALSSIFYWTILTGRGFGYYLSNDLGTAHLETEPLEITLEQGIIGLAVWLLLFVFIVYQAKKNSNQKQYSYLLIAILLLFLISSLMNPVLFNPKGFAAIGFGVLLTKEKTA